MRPLHDKIVVKPLSNEEKTAGGIIIPVTAKEKPARGTVIAAGPGRPDDPTSVIVGETAIYPQHCGIPITVDGTDYLILRESEIIAVF
jgi:chaperonin GroES